MRAGPPSRRLLWLPAGLAVWGSALVALYGLHALGCGLLWPSAAIRLSLWAVLLLHLAVLLALGRVLRRRRIALRTQTAGFLGTVIGWSFLAALAATLLGLAPPLLLSVCL